MSRKELVSYESPEPRAHIHRLVFVMFERLGRGTIYPPSFCQSFKTNDFANGCSILHFPEGRGIRWKALHLAREKDEKYHVLGDFDR